LGICHTVSNKEYISCAFTQKVVKFCEMMKSSYDAKINMTTDEIIKHPTIHHLIHYGHENSTTDADEHVSVTNDKILLEAYGDYNWKKEFFKHKAYDIAHNTFTQNCKIELEKRIKDGDIVLCFWGFGHQDIVSDFHNIGLIVEPGIGYDPDSSFANFKVFESYACMHNYYGNKKILHPSWYDCVIPNYFNEDDFKLTNDDVNNDNYGYKNYYLYLGRLIREKGLDVIMHLAKTKGFRLILAGQGDLNDLGYSLSTLPRNIQYVGYADIQKRKILMTNARALLLPTMYIEPFGGVVVEAMFCGTPVITTDWGVFNETVLHGITGYRCRTLDQFEYAIDNVDKLDSNAIKQWATNNYGYVRIRQMYEEYFSSLLNVKFNKGFMLQNTDRINMNWLTLQYPTIKKTNKKINKEKLLMITETKHAFGTITSALQKYSKKYDIDIVDWSLGFPEENKLKKYKKIYITVIDVCIKLLNNHSNLLITNNISIYYSGHGLIDFIKQDYDTLQHKIITNKMISDFDIDGKFIKLIEKTLPSMVSKEMINLFKTKYNINLPLTECGYDKTIYFPNAIENNNKQLTIANLFPLCYNETMYASKRTLMIDKLKNFANNNDMIFTYPAQLSTQTEMCKFYQSADVFICLSHSEGNPLGGFEAGGCGLVGLSTTVGAMPQFIIENENGFLIDNTMSEDDIYKYACDKLIYLRDNPKILKQMKINMKKIAYENWTWEHKIDAWDNYFDKTINMNDIFFKKIGIDYDFIEIGTSNFDTLLENCDDNAYGISIEPIAHYLDQLPNKKNVTKLNVAIESLNDRSKNSKKEIEIYHIPEQVITDNKLPDWLKGCNSIINMHPLHVEHNLTHLVQKDMIKTMTILEIYNIYNIRNVKILKIDIEGYDLKIMKDLFDLIDSKIIIKPNTIIFESNKLTDADELQQILKRSTDNNYAINIIGCDVILTIKM